MNEQDLHDILKDTQEVLVQVDKRLQRMEKNKSEIKDYSAELGDIGKRLESNIQDETLIGLKASILKQAGVTDSLVTALDEQKKAISLLPRRIKVKVDHQITGKQRPYIITGAVLILISVFSLLASFQLWRSNSALNDGDIKIRMVRLIYPSISSDIDSIYDSDPKKLRSWVRQEEERLHAIGKAEENARQSTEKAERAKEKLLRLKNNKGKH